MVEGCVRGDGSICLLDNNKCYVFNTFGRFETCIDVPYDVIASKVCYNVISVLSTAAGVTVGVFDSTDFTEVESDNSIVLKLTAHKGYICRLMPPSGVAEGVRYTQIIFVYSNSVNVKEVLHEVIGK